MLHITDYLITKGLNMRLYTFLFLLVYSLFFVACKNNENADYFNQKRKSVKTVDDVFKPLPAGTVTIDGWLGGRMDSCMKNRVMVQNIGRFINPFAEHNNNKWESEYWGKWFTSVIFGYLYQPTAEHRARIDEAVTELLKTQTPDGQITGFDSTQQLGYNWDLWGRKYALLGLIAYFDATGDKRSLQAAQRAADVIINEVNKGMIVGERCLNLFLGVQSTSILAEFAMLYVRTGEERYRKMAELIVKQYDNPNKIAPKGLRLVTDALADKPPAEIGTRKCYETLANYEGLIELYRATGNKRYLDAASIYLKNVFKQERMIHGSMSNNEEWFYGVKNQTCVLEQPVETCVTAQWMLICWQMLRLTGNPKWADELELSLYNALLGVMTPDGHWWSYFSHLKGERIPCHFQHEEARMACCVTSGPRGLLLTPQWAVMYSEDGIVINLYEAGSANVRLDDGIDVNFLLETGYPLSDTVKITINPAKEKQFKLRLRIPSWSNNTKLSVNGQKIDCKPGQYTNINRLWKRSDQIILILDMRVRAIKAPSGAPELALARGPVLLALDNRMVKVESRAVYIETDNDGYVAAKSVKPACSGIWMAYEVPVYTRRGCVKQKLEQFNLIFCDYPSAGNQWVAINQFRTWIPQPLYLENAFIKDAWKLTYGDNRPAMPSVSYVGH